MTSFTQARFAVMKGRLLSGCAILGFAFSVSLAANAQVAGTIIDVIGSLNIETTGTTTSVNFDGQQNIIRWNPTGPSNNGITEFLPAGSTLAFDRSGDVFTVLNQFVNANGGTFTDIVAINGAVTGNDRSNIWFQNGAGIIVGSTAQFDVGALVLTTREITHDLTEISGTVIGSLTDPNGYITFGGNGGSGAVENRGTINAIKNPDLGLGYVAMVAPRIVQSGTVSTDGSIAYLAAEQAVVRISAGIVDISVTQGADGGTVIDHSGTSAAFGTNGPDFSTGSQQNVFFVAVPKNDAITMLVGGTLGHYTANVATPSDGSIILSAGYDSIESGQIGLGRPTTGPASNIQIGTTNANGNFEANATGTINSAATINVTGGASFTANDDITLGTVTTSDTASFDSLDGDVIIQSLNAVSNIRLLGNAVTVNGGISMALSELYAYDGDTLITSSGDITVSETNLAGNATFNAGGDILFRSLNAQGSAQATSARTIIVNGSINASDLTLSSRDIELEGFIQTQQSGSITLINNDSSRATLIGSGNLSDGYYLDLEEINGLSSGNIIIRAPTTAGGDPAQVIVQDFTYYFGDGGNFSIISDADITVQGAANILNQGGAFNVSLTAGRALNFISGEGSLTLGTGSFDNLGGILNLSAPKIMMATQSAITDLAAATISTQYEDRLTLNDGVAPYDIVAAGTINVAVDDGFFVQNTSDGTTSADRRGLLFGSGGLNITTGGGTPLMVLNAIYETPNGPLTGAQAIQGVTVNGGPPADATGFSPQSLMNNCLLANAAVCGPDALIQPPPPINPDPPNPPNTIIPEFPIQVIIDEPIKNDEDEDVITEERESSSIPNTLISMRDLDPLTGEPLVDDPVTGAGNDDLWGPVTE